MRVCPQNVNNQDIFYSHSFTFTLYLQEKKTPQVLSRKAFSFLLTGNIYRGVVPLEGVSGKSWRKLPGHSCPSEWTGIAFYNDHYIGLPVLGISGLNHFSLCFRPANLLSTLRSMSHLQ